MKENRELLYSNRDIERFFGEFPLMSASLRVTKLCTLSCQHCYANANLNVKRQEEMTFQEITDVIDQIAQIGAMEIFFTGGEPLVRQDDIVQILQYAHQRGLRVLISSNGTLVNTQFLEQVKNIPFKLFQISLDGPEAVHEAIRGPKSFKKATDALQAASKILGKHVAVGSVMMKYNAATLGQVMAIGHGLGADIFALMLLIVSGRADATLEPDPFEQQRSLDAIFEVYRKLEGRLKFAVNTTLPPALVPADLREQGLHRRFALCSFPNILGIEANGDVAPCDGFFNNSECIVGNIRNTPLHTIWQESPLLREIRQVEPSDLAGVCGRCIFREYCAGGCRASAYLASGKLNTPDPICQRFFEANLFPKDCLR